MVASAVSKVNFVCHACGHPHSAPAEYSNRAIAACKNCGQHFYIPRESNAVSRKAEPEIVFEELPYKPPAPDPWRNVQPEPEDVSATVISSYRPPPPKPSAIAVAASWLKPAASYAFGRATQRRVIIGFVIFCATMWVLRKFEEQARMNDHLLKELESVRQVHRLEQLRQQLAAPAEAEAEVDRPRDRLRWIPANRR